MNSNIPSCAYICYCLLSVSEIGDEIQTPRSGGGKAKLRRGSNQKMKSDQPGEPSQARADMEKSISIVQYFIRYLKQVTVFRVQTISVLQPVAQSQTLDLNTTLHPNHPLKICGI